MRPAIRRPGNIRFLCIVTENRDFVKFLRNLEFQVELACCKDEIKDVDKASNSVGWALPTSLQKHRKREKNAALDGEGKTNL